MICNIGSSQRLQVPEDLINGIRHNNSDSSHTVIMLVHQTCHTPQRQDKLGHQKNDDLWIKV